MVLMPLVRYLSGFTPLVSTGFQMLPVRRNLDGRTYHVFDYVAGNIASGGGGGLAYFLAVEITLSVTQVINFFLQRNVTFKPNTSVIRVVVQYFIA